MRQFTIIMMLCFWCYSASGQDQSTGNTKNNPEEIGTMAIIPPPGGGGSLWNKDADGDGYGNPNITMTSTTQPIGYVANALDCDDTNALRNPDTIWYKDADGDGFGNPNDTRTQCSQPSSYILTGGDCNDSDANVNPNKIWYRDVDNDGFGTASPTTTSCTQPSGYTGNSLDNCPTDPGAQNGCPVGNVTLSDENYVFQRLYKNKFTNPLTAPTTVNVIDEVTYFDGLGRPMQHIAIRQAAETQEDIVTHIGYDVFGREDKKYLPYPEVTGIPGELRSGSVLKTQNHYKNNYGADFPGVTAGSTNPYSETLLETSPLNRPLEQGAPGTAWKVNATSNADHTVKFDYGTNTGSEVRLFNVSLSSTYSPTLVQSTSSYFTAGSLSKSITKDENWTSGSNNTTEEFKDKQGRVVLKRTYNAGVAHDTYYVYDIYGNLTYVIPPKVTNDVISSTELSELCYQYKYDNRNRLVEKKIPGKEWEYIVYNKLDQPILTQDAVQRAKTTKEWLYTKYDVQGRVIASGIHSHSAASQAAMQTVVDNYYTSNSTVKMWEDKTTSSTNDYYTNQSYPTSSNEVLILNYYDNYTFNHVNLKLPAGSLIFNDNVEYTTKGLPTGSRVKVLDQTTPKWITTITHYNTEGRTIYTASYNDFLLTTDKVKYQLDFMGNILKTETDHKKGTNASIVTLDEFSYDHVNRLTQHTQSINGSAKELISKNTYDKLGQLKSKGVGNIATSSTRLQDIDYTYNVRGWLKQINYPGTLGDDLFGFKLNYNTVGHSGTPLFNGNIAETEWRTANTDNNLKWYRYGYDNLSRITSATANSSNYNVSGISYDKNGNITNLTRTGAINATSTSFGNMDALGYTYIGGGNRLQAVNDTGNATYGFVNGTALTTEYTYDTNGNMLTDSNKGITGITYNHLNLPKSVNIGGGTITYIYDATGVKQRKVAGTTTTDYAGNYMYKNNVLQFFNHPEGYVENNAGTYKYHYQYKDHLGNIRLSYFNNGTANSPSVVISEENNYYPFGLRQKGYNDAPNGHGNSAAKMFKFGGKELQDETIGGKNLDWYDFHARNYDATLGRWMNMDPLAEQGRRFSPFIYAFNNPNYFIDPDGMWPFPSGPTNFSNILVKMYNGIKNYSNSSSSRSSSGSSSSASTRGGVMIANKNGGATGDRELIRNGGRAGDNIDWIEDIANPGPFGPSRPGRTATGKKNAASAFLAGTDDGGTVESTLDAAKSSRQALDEINEALPQEEEPLVTLTVDYGRYKSTSTIAVPSSQGKKDSIREAKKGRTVTIHKPEQENGIDEE